MKKQTIHMWIRILMVLLWMAEYAWFLTCLLEEPFNRYYGAAYFLLVYFFVLKKIGGNTNRKYEIHVEAFGRLLAANGIWSLFLLAAKPKITKILPLVLKVTVLTLAEAAGFVLLFSIYKMIVKKSKKTEVCFVGKEDNRREILDKIEKSDTVFLNDLPAENRNEWLKYCCRRQKQAYCTAKLSDIILRSSGLAQYNDTPVWFYDRPSQENIVVKRILDMVFALLLLLLLSPVFLVTACCIKAEDGGSIIYRQTRCTKDMKQFQIYKFRSMVPNAERKRGARLAEKNDIRLTRVGRFIRNTKLDELPQLVNILKGEMSFVGPRPERPEFIEEAIKDIPEFALRTRVKAGLTGYAQVMGSYHTEFLDKLKWDFLYIENQSLFLDFKIILMTGIAILRKDNHEDFSKWEK